jgi:Flp pilus assembly protein TadG
MRVRRDSSRRSGASAVEMAVVAPVFVALVIGQIETSRLGMVAQLITTACREGCRTATLPGSQQSDVQNRVQSVLTGSGIPVPTITPTCPSPYSWQTAPGGTPITVSMSVPYSAVSWLGTPFYLSGANVSASATMSSENP